MREIECKWIARSIRDYKLFIQRAQDLGAKLSRQKEVQNKDQYLDTPENFFQTSQLVCRIRLSNGRSELTLKSYSEPDQEFFNRYEKTIKLPHFNSQEAALKYVRNKFFRKIQPLFEILNNRQVYTLILPGGGRAEACFDKVLMLCGKKQLRMHEIELEFKSGSLEKFKAFVNKLSSLPLNPSKSSKFELAKIHLLGDSPTCSMDTLNDLANGILEIQFDKLKKSEAIVRKSFDADAIHDMRVSIRRIRAAIATFKKIMPINTKKIRTELQKVGQVLGKKRDLDVFSAFILHTISRGSYSLPTLEQSQKQILSMLKSKWYAKLIGSLEHLKTVTTKQNIFKASRKRIRRALDRVFEIAPSIDPKIDDKILHKLRIAVKKLRYTCEFFEDTFSKYVCSLDSFIEKTKKIQDVLGEHQDAITGISMLIRYKSHFSVEEFIRIKKKYEEKKKRTRHIFFKVWKDFLEGIDSGIETVLMGKI